MKDTLFILCFGLLTYLGFATIFGDTALMGSYGAVFAQYNHKYFGYISYMYIFASLIPLYIFYKQSSINSRVVELSVASVLVFFALLLAQALLITNELRGEVVAGFVNFLSPFIGLFGLWTLWFIIAILSMVIIFDRSAHEMVDVLYAKLKKSGIKREDKGIKKSFEAKSKSNSIAKVYANFNKEQKEQESSQDYTQDVVEIKVEPEIEVELEIDQPAYLRKEQPKVAQESKKVKEHNILELVHEIKEQKNTIVVEELEENAKLLATIEKGSVEKPKNFKLPSIEFLQKPNNKAHSVDESELDGKIKFLIEKLAHFKIDGDVVRTYAGPVVSTFEFKPAANVKVSRILNLQDDLAMALSAETIRIQAPIPGKDVVGIEIPNEKIDTIYLRELIDSKLFQESSSPLTIVLGKDIVGKPFITDLKKLPHLLIAGTTGSGKSVGINAMILSLLYKNSPDQLRLLMIDPKMLEFSIYNDIPHLLTPVITKAKQAIVALNNMVHEMERRYALMSENRTKNIESYNEKVKKEGGEHLPYIVVIIDELADLMMTSGKDVEISIARLAQMARASGIHLVVATQRPSVDVVTGLIKANLPSRISYRVGQKVDSKIILDQQGAESLLGKGDMLFTPPGSTGLVRLHAPWSTEEEIEKIVDFIKSQRAPNYDKSFLIEENENSYSSNESYEELDPMFDEAKNVVLSDRKTSISYLQRKLQIGYNKSARLIEQLENEGILSAPNSKGMRDIL
ncbi:Cell divisionFtsK/SpoIIIE [Sulfurimonas denitrificans DSM 1251]|uniref:Cell divisionFtsK/SpoIIIE n=1 Tax=Sulfurimonas denitrificans (strain ATCC 33889 / DSM 1251) TaxID=326298 RepID=Q30RR5_SULDN|nr:DNA translocase FtsK [Sulfurimonas denitrificans]ABB44316.1 Cell divisionFtsK/SpoIIIE [Sulfurimonas denitrificans DSM 1251]MDD3441990.1 DNA translocase FtsK [Sulfurimonas denitrificans]